MSQNLYITCEALILASFILSLSRKTLALSCILFFAYILSGLCYIFLRYYWSFPMTPMYLGTAASAPVLALFGAISLGMGLKPRFLLLYRSLCILVFLLGLSQVLFPKDYYLPFLKTATFFSHMHLAFTILGKAAFFLSGLWAINYMVDKTAEPRYSSGRFFLFLVLGFVCWTLSMFAGEVWSYLGWGLPVVWDDAVIVTYMATWFFYIGLLHLHLAGRFSTLIRAIASAVGIAWLLVVNCIPDLGPYRPLF
ncbi:MAG: hypothetical protein LBE27_06525 [Deltaproteobacteria bacterium]|jgi:hypothetical protein|nr:hypothetical protein [Deltaproteobacteria bacterium]